MGALSAVLHNSFIKAQYNRLLEKGKSKMQAVIASTHKLLRLGFGILKSGKMFDDIMLGCMLFLEGKMIFLFKKLDF